MNYGTIQLADIPLQALTPHKVTLAHYGAQDHCRWVFRGRSAGTDDPLFYKIWNPTYVRRDNILAAIDSGFYDERTVPALHSIVFHKGICRGYVMHQGGARRNTVSTAFRDLVFLRTGQTGFFTVQFAPCHAMLYRDGWSLVDLEGVYPIEALPRLSEFHCAFEDPAYEKFVALLHRHLSSNPDNAARQALPAVAAMASRAIAESTAESASQEGRSDVPYLHIRLGRRARRRLRNLLPRVELIAY